MSEELKDCCMGCRPADCECDGCCSAEGSEIKLPKEMPPANNHYISYFETEKNIILKNCPDYIIYHAMEACDKEIKGILEKIDDGWSGMSAGYYIRAFSDMFKRILSFKPLSPLTFQDNEWNETYGFDDGEKHYQNRRMYSVFKEVKPNGEVTITDNDASYHTSPFKYDAAENKYFEDKEYGDIGWSGAICIFNPDTDEYTIVNSAEIINLKDFAGDNQHQLIKTIEVFDSSNPRSDYEFHLTTMAAIPEDFFKDYKLLPITGRDWVDDTLEIINTPRWKEFIKQHAADLLK